MSKEKIKVSVQILENNYALMCEPHEQTMLVEAAERLNATLHELRMSNPKLPLERLLIIGALQIAFELTQEQYTQAKDIAAVNKMSASLLSALDQELADPASAE